MRSRPRVARSKHVFTACLLAVLFVFCGCVDLDEIAQYAKVSQDVGKSFSGASLWPWFSKGAGSDFSLFPV